MINNLVYTTLFEEFPSRVSEQIRLVQEEGGIHREILRIVVGRAVASEESRDSSPLFASRSIAAPYLNIVRRTGG